MIYAFICKDGGDKSELRRTHLMAHLRYVESVLDKMILAGPCPAMRAGDNRRYQGALVMYRADSPEEAKALLENDPYFRNGIWEAYDVMPFEPAAGELVGGKTWDISGGTYKPVAVKK